MTPVPAGAVVTVSFTGQLTSPLTFQDFASQLAAQLAQDNPPLMVRSSKIDGPDLLSAILTGQWFHYSYSATLVLQTATAAASVDDIVKQVVADVVVVSGHAPAASAIVTGGNPSPAAGDTPTHLLPDLSGIANALDVDVKLVLFGAVALVGLLIVMLATGPNVPKLAKVSF